MIDYSAIPAALVVRLVTPRGSFLPRQEFRTRSGEWSADRDQALSMDAAAADRLARELTSPAVHVFPISTFTTATQYRNHPEQAISCAGREVKVSALRLHESKQSERGSTRRESPELNVTQGRESLTPSDWRTGKPNCGLE